MLKALCKKYKPDIVGIDQLSLMDDDRRGENRRLQLSNITMDLFRISEELGIPVLADAQANRNKTNTEEPENPELADIGEADAIGQNSSRVISLVQTKLGLSLLVTKNRYGENNKKFNYLEYLNDNYLIILDEISKIEARQRNISQGLRRIPSYHLRMIKTIFRRVWQIL